MKLFYLLFFLLIFTCCDDINSKSKKINKELQIKNLKLNYQLIRNKDSFDRFVLEYHPNYELLDSQLNFNLRKFDIQYILDSNNINDVRRWIAILLLKIHLNEREMFSTGDDIRNFTKRNSTLVINKYLELNKKFINTKSEYIGSSSIFSTEKNEKYFNKDSIVLSLVSQIDSASKYMLSQFGSKKIRKPHLKYNFYEKR